jgi:hypothetical protein
MSQDDKCLSRLTPAGMQKLGRSRTPEPSMQLAGFTIGIGVVAQMQDNVKKMIKIHDTLTPLIVKGDAHGR